MIEQVGILTNEARTRLVEAVVSLIRGESSQAADTSR
jgi:hypothetical protein